MPTSVRKAQDDLVVAARAAANRDGISFAGEASLRLTLVLWFGGRRGDLDNPLKRIVDALAEALAFNDSRIVELHAYRDIGEVGIWAEIATIGEEESSA